MSVKWKYAVIMLTVFVAPYCVASADVLEEMFLNPPEATKPRCYWYWMDGHISEEGITKDLEAMKRVGIGEGYIGVISGESGMPADSGPKALTDDWWKFIEHAVREGGRIGVDIGIFNSPGWSQSGGPWVKPEESMRYVVLPETRLRGPQHFEGKLPAPIDACQDVAVVAFPAPAGEDSHAVETKRTARSVIFEMEAPFTARSLTVQPVEKINVMAILQASDDGKNYRPVKEFIIDRHNLNVNVGPVPLAPVVVAFPEVTARFFRLEFSRRCKVGDVLLSPVARVESYAEKSLIKMFQDPLPPFDFYTWKRQAEPDTSKIMIDAGSVIDISGLMTPDGTLQWDVPDGEWIVLRAVLAPTGVKNSPAPPEATGLEVDKMNRTALKAHFDAYIGNLLQRVPPEERKALKHVVADSYEMGPQNWTDGFAMAFQSRYGYDPVKWLPVLTGRIVGSADQSNRFLWDLRRLVADMIAREYVGGLSDLCNEHGLKMWLENYGHWGFPAEFLQYGGYCDEISGEFWVTGDLGSIELRDAASAAHIYGKKVVWAEAFTGGPAFVNTPRDLKARGDWAFCEGINQFVLHVNIHQPWEDRRPGVNAWFGTEFNRHNTWFEYAGSWIEYLRRCSVMLQSGMHVADVAYYIGEDAPKMAGNRKPELPAGYDFDYINADVIENGLVVQEGRFVLADGMSYHLLVLPESDTMRPDLLKKIQQLVADGGTVMGSAPKHSPSMENFPACDEEVKALVKELWDAGKIMTGDSLARTFNLMNLAPDVICPEGILWKHRRNTDGDIYFVSNQKPETRSENISFRVTGKVPELWWPEDGRIDLAPAYTMEDGRTTVSLDFDSLTSVFVVFRKEAEIKNSAGGKKNVQQLLGTELTGSWTVMFPTKQVNFEKLISWTEHADADIKYFSGAATYQIAFEIDDASTNMLLDLGEVHAVAKVCVNGKELGTLWKPPYRLDITSAIRKGSNVLEVTIVNAWNNRLVGDQQADVMNATTFITAKTVKAETPLQTAGLLGPVQLIKN